MAAADSLTEREAYVALNLLPRIGPVRIRRLLDYFSTPQAILAAPETALTQVKGIEQKLAAVVRDWESLTDLAHERRRAKEVGARVIIPTDEEYPAPLREAYDHPFVLYIRGALTDADRHAIGVVGSRRMTTYGRGATTKFSRTLASAGYTIVSGLARGVDTLAHEAAISAGGRTVAVIGSGLGELYPPENRTLAEKIAGGHGAVISEFPIDFPPDKRTFPQRNRIVAAWGLGLLVVEAPARSGSLITAEQANGYGRHIFAVPGPIDRQTSEGCNNLIREGSTLVTKPEHILDDLGNMFSAEKPTSTTSPSQLNKNLSPDESLVYDALADGETTQDVIASTTGLTISTVSTTLLRLEMKRLIDQLPGARAARR